jgi:hypothetical protein
MRRSSIVCKSPRSDEERSRVQPSPLIGPRVPGYVRWRIRAVLYSILRYEREEVKWEEQMNARGPHATNKFAFRTSGILFKHIRARLLPICRWA